jgi:hypothetical protein
MIQRLTSRDQLARAWLVLFALGCLTFGLGIAFDVYPALVLVDRLRAPWALYDVGFWPAVPRSAVPFALVLSAWATLTGFLAVLHRRRELLASAVLAVAIAWWLVATASPFWTELAIAVTGVALAAVLLPVLFLNVRQRRQHET